MATPLVGPQGQYLNALSSPTATTAGTSTKSLSQKYKPGSQEWIDATFAQEQDDYLSDLKKSLASRGVYNSAYSASEEAAALDTLRRDIELKAAEYAVDESRYQDELAENEKNRTQTAEENAKNRKAANRQQNLAVGAAVAQPFLTNFIQTSGFNPLTALYDKSGLANLFSSSVGGASSSLPSALSLPATTGTNNFLSGLSDASMSYPAGLGYSSAPDLALGSTGSLGQYYSPTSSATPSFGETATANLKDNFSMANAGNMLGQTAVGGGLGMLLGDSAKNAFLTSGLGTLAGSALGAIPGLGALGSLGGYLAPALKKIFNW